MALRLAPVLLAAALLAPSTAAAAQRCEAPPGTSAIDQYCETVPGAGGDSATGGGSSTDDAGAAAGATSTPVPAATLRSLDDQGADGKRLADALRSGSTGSSVKKASRSAAVGGSADSSSEPAPASSPVDAVRSAVSDGQTVGSALPWGLLAVTVLMAGLAWVRLRGRSPDALD